MTRSEKAMKPFIPGPKASGPSLSFRVCCFLAANPDEELTTSDVMDKYGREVRASVWQSLDAAVRHGWIVRAKPKGKFASQNLYTAGPELLKEIGSEW